MLLTVTGALVFGVVVAALAPSSSVVVAPAKVTGDAPPAVAGELTGASSRGVVDAGAAPVDMPSGCADDTCATKAAGVNGFVLSTTVDVQDSDYAITIRLIDATGKVVDERSESCEICNYDEVAETLEGMVKAAVAPVSEATPPPPPPPTGSTPAAAEPVDESKDERDPPKVLRPLGFAGVGVGLGALAGGVALMVLNERPAGSCDGTHVDPNGDCEFRYNTLGAGAGLAIGGALAIGVGVGLLVLSRGQKSEEPNANVSVSASAGGFRLRF